MASANFLRNDPITVAYKSAKSQSGQTIQMDVWSASQTLDVTQSGVMTEITGTGLYNRIFTPDTVGTWIVACYESGKPQTSVIQSYSVGNFNIESLGDGIVSVTSIAGDIQTSVEAFEGPPMIG